MKSLRLCVTLTAISRIYELEHTMNDSLHTLDCDNGYNNDEDHQILEALKIPTVQRLSRSFVVRGVYSLFA